MAARGRCGVLTVLSVSLWMVSDAAANVASSGCYGPAVAPTGLSIAGCILLAATTALIFTDNFFDPALNLRGDLSIWARKSPFSERESSPLWYWVTNCVLSLLSFLLIFAGLFLTRCSADNQAHSAQIFRFSKTPYLWL